MEHADARGVRIAYDDRGTRGSAPVLLCLPGWCVNRGFFDALADCLATSNRVLSLDWRGHGDSGPAAGELGHPELLEDALAVIEASRAQTVIPIGQAHGAWIGIELRRRLGARVPALVANSWLILDPPPPFLGMLEALQDQARWQGARDQLLAMWTTGAPERVAERVRHEMGAYGFEMWGRAARSIAGAYQQHGNPLRATAALTPGVRLLHLFSQPKAPEFLAAQEGYARENPWFEVHRLDAVSHFPALEAPEAVAAAIERFLATL